MIVITLDDVLVLATVIVGIVVAIVLGGGKGREQD